MKGILKKREPSETGINSLYLNIDKRFVKILSFLVCLMCLVSAVAGNKKIDKSKIYPKKGCVDTAITLNSLRQAGNLYCMNYVGDYHAILEAIDLEWISGKKQHSQFNCSLFATLGDSSNNLMGRNFDNASCDVLVARYNPPDGYASLAFTRISDVNLAMGTDYLNLPWSQKLKFLKSAYYVPDGINEKGLATGLAWVPPVMIAIDPSKDSIFITRLVREILDHAQNPQEALQIANSYNVFDMIYQGSLYLQHHLLISTAAGESLIIEYHDGAFQIVEPTDPWQIITNKYVYNVPLEQLLNTCPRYNWLYNCLLSNSGVLTWQQGMNALSEVNIGQPDLSSQWSALYDLENRGLYVAVHSEYDNLAYIDLDGFNCISYGRFDIEKLFVSDANNNGVLEAGEQVMFDLSVVSQFDANGVYAVISSSDSNITVINDSIHLGNMNSLESYMNSGNGFMIQIAETIMSRNVDFSITFYTEYGHSYATPFSIFVGNGDILIIDDDEGKEYEDYYIEALEALDLQPHHYDAAFNDKPKAELLKQYEKVIWFTGDEGDSALTIAEQQTITEFLNQGGKLFLNGQHIGENAGSSAFFQNYLHTAYQGNTVTQDVVGVEGDTIGDGVSLSISGTGGANNQISPDKLNPLDGAHNCLLYEMAQSGAGICFAGDYKLVYFGFGFEAVADNVAGFTTRSELMERVLNFLDDNTGVQLVKNYKSIFLSVFPNPVSDQCVIEFELLNPTVVKLDVLNVTGVAIANLVSKKMHKGKHQFVWKPNIDGALVNGGVYFIRFQSDDADVMEKIMIQK